MNLGFGLDAFTTPAGHKQSNLQSNSGTARRDCYRLNVRYAGHGQVQGRQLARDHGFSYV